MPKSEEKRKSRSGPKKKNESLALLRALTKSMAGAIPGLSEETRDTVEDSMARPVSGFASQVLGEDPNEPGKLVFPPLHNLKRSWNADERRKQGLPREKMAMPGLVQDTLSLPSILGGGPQWAQDASESADRIHSGVDEGMGLAPPQGFRQHALNAAGMMGAQIPVAGSAKKATDIGRGALHLTKKYGKRALASPVEFFLPTIDPKMSNYLFGSVAGGGIGTLGDEAGEIVEELPPKAIARAEGGKVGALKEFLRAVSINPYARVKQTAHQIGDPIEEVLQATNEGQAKGVISGDEAQRIKAMLASGEEESLTEALMELHRRLNPPALKDPTLQKLPSKEELVFPTTKGYREPVHGHGQLSDEEYERIINPGEARGGIMRKSTGGKVKMVQDLLRMFKERDLDPDEFGIIDENGNLDIDEAKAILDDAVEGEREVDDFVEDLGVTEPEQITQKIQQSVSGTPPRREPEQGDEISDDEWSRIRNRMKDWKVQSVYDLEDILSSQTTEKLRIPIPSMSKWTNWPDEPGTQKKKLDILKNPKSQEDVIRWAGDEVPKIRFMTDQDGNTYVWDADKAIHDQVLEALGLSRKGLFHEMTDTPIPPKMFDQYFFSNPWE